MDTDAHGWNGHDMDLPRIQYLGNGNSIHAYSPFCESVSIRGYVLTYRLESIVPPRKTS